MVVAKLLEKRQSEIEAEASASLWMWSRARPCRNVSWKRFYSKRAVENLFKKLSLPVGLPEIEYSSKTQRRILNIPLEQF